MTENSRHVPFRESIISQAPESREPFVIRDGSKWPFQEIKLDKKSSAEEVVFEARSPFKKGENPMVVRVFYEEGYGLKVKRTIVSEKFPDSELVMESGEIRCNLGEVDIVFATYFNSPIATETRAKDPKYFSQTISIDAGDKRIPSIAYAEYDRMPQVPIAAKFVLAEFQDVLDDKFKKLEKSSLYPYETTYFRWETLVGAIVGITTCDDASTNRDHFKWRFHPTEINSTKYVQLGDSQYREKISRSISSDREWGNGRLRFSRINSQTGESWILSVPESIDRGNFNRDIQEKSLREFFDEYPVVFCVQNKKQGRKWFSVPSGHSDKAR